MKRLVFQKRNFKTNYFESDQSIEKDLETFCFFTDEEIKLEDEKNHWLIEPYVHFSYFNEKVGMRLKEVTYNKITDSYEVKEYKEGKKSEFRLSTKILEEIVNLEACIVEEIAKQKIDGISRTSFSVEYDSNKQYIRLGNINKRVKEYLVKFDELELEEEVIKFGEYKMRKIYLERFKQELIDNFEKDEHHLEACLKKYQDLLPLVLPNVNATLQFQYRILENDDQDINISDVLSDDDGDNMNIIELKRADCVLFDKRKKYRNNTFNLSREFSGAIQQASVQRARLANVRSDKYSSLAKSTLIIGNQKSEFIGKHEEDLYYNFKVVRYNNKDCEIITYDEIVKNIDKLLILMDSARESIV